MDAWRTQVHVSGERLAGDLRDIGLVDGDIVLVHSSLSRLGYVEGGANTVVDALLQAVAPGGTGLFPTLTGSEQDGPKCPPRMDARTTPGWTGRIPETARIRPDARRSLHPTHSVVALGAHARRYVLGHERSCTPCDEQSPYYRLIDERGKILLLGVSQQSNTTLHCLEELAGVPYHLQAETTDGVVIDADGSAHIVRNRLHLWRWERDFDRIDGPLVAANAMRIGRVGLAEARLIQADRLADVILPLLRNEPLYLLAPEARRELERGVAPGYG